MDIRKAVIPVAGLGTRLFPTTKVLPKEMLPVGRFPTIQYVVEELAATSLTRMLFVTSRENSIVENQFDSNADIVIHLAQNGRLEEGMETDFRSAGIEFFYLRQHMPPGSTKPPGTGAAISDAEGFVGSDHFVVAYGDTIIQSNGDGPNFLTRMVETHHQMEADVTICVRPVPDCLVPSYGIVQPMGEVDETRPFLASDVVEKPPLEKAPSNLAVSARYIFSPAIFPHIHQLERGSDGEIGVTDAIATLIQDGGKVCCLALGEHDIRYDIGNHESYFKAFIDFALNDPQCGDAIRNYLRSVTEQKAVS